MEGCATMNLMNTFTKTLSIHKKKLLFSGLFLLSMPIPRITLAEQKPILEVFHGAECPHCHSELEWLPSLQKEFPDLIINEYEVWHNPKNKALMAERLFSLNKTSGGVPTNIIGDELIIGFDSKKIIAAIKRQNQIILTEKQSTVPENNTPKTKEFLDVPEKHLHYNAIMWARENNIITGYDNNTFKPDHTINRAEFVKILMGSDVEKTSHCFSDIKSEWFAKYVCTAKEQKILNGYPDGNFRPSNEINFAEVAKILVTKFEIKTSKSGKYWFTPFIEAIESKVELPSSIKDPGHKVTRGEMTELIAQMTQSR